MSESYHEMSQLMIQKMATMTRPFVEANEKNATSMTHQVNRLCGVQAERIQRAQPYGYSGPSVSCPGQG